jgi:hypothetical protein
MPVRQIHLKQLAPYLIGEEPREGNGEWDMYCPLHEDTKRSASLNVEKGTWYCFAGCSGGSVVGLIRRKSEWVSPDAAARNGGGRPRRGSTGEPEVVTEAMVTGWSAALRDNIDSSLDWIVEKRALNSDTLTKYSIGWDRDREVYTIPVRDDEGTLLNVRRYNPRPVDDRRKIWGITGMNTPRLYPGEPNGKGPIIVCEGEWDALRTIQEGYNAVTRTAAARVWQPEWTELFKGKDVYLCHDADDTGMNANRRVGRELYKVAKSVKIITLPYPVEEKHGKDLSDFWVDHDKDYFERLLREAKPYRKKKEDQEPELVSVLDSFDSRRIGEPVRLLVTMKGKREPGYSIPQKAHLSCTMDAGPKCAFCPLKAAHGEADHVIRPDDPATLELIDATALQLADIVRRSYGALKCQKLVVEVSKHQAVETLFARQALDHSSGSAADYKNVKITSVGRHDTSPNTTHEVIGSLYPNPRSQSNEFLAWEVNSVQTAVDHFELTDAGLGLMRRFQPNEGTRPIAKLGSIARAISEGVTHIYGRPVMHAMMILTWHSLLSLPFEGKILERGWLDTLALGDTRTGKSEAALRILKHYSAGEIVGGESSTFAGLVGGLQQFGTGREWAVSWGAIPINDRRLVVIDEASGLQPEDIAKMSDVRSSGQARLTKIQQELTWARTRLLWLSNPRGGSMSDYTWGVNALRPLIGNPEDIARFDLVCAVSLDDVPAEEINRRHAPKNMKYTSEACNTLVRWAWTRTVDHIRWESGAEQAVYDAALAMGKRYTEDPPLLQAANSREKIARVAAALAAAVFSSPDGEQLIIKVEHVRDAATFIDRLYSMPTLGYAARSAETIADRTEAKGNRADVRKYLRNNVALSKFLRGTAKFRRQDVEEVMNVSREQANGIINKLWDSRMITKEAGDIRVQPALHELLREVQK